MDDDFRTIRVLSRPQTIKTVGVSERTWERLEADGDVPPKTRLSEGRIGYRVSDIEAWLDARREGGSWQQLGGVAREVCADIRDHQIKMQAELNRRREKGA
jgi:predicted DNA-binding transcriptional regulator AlpA